MKVANSVRGCEVSITFSRMLATCLWLGALLAVSSCSALRSSPPKVEGEMQQWHRISLTFDGPNASEQDAATFRDYRMEVTFRNENRTLVVPGFFAADGIAGESGASEGNKWRVYFSPDEAGTWSFEASFRKGTDVVLSPDSGAGSPSDFDGQKGTFTISASEKTGRDFRAKGRLTYVGQRYLQFAATKEYFLKGGADSPEDFFGYSGFDQTPPNVKTSRPHDFTPHVQDWKEGDPTWKDGRGKGIIGALNYLAEEGMNSVYFMLMNRHGDGDNVWPWVDGDTRDRFDVSKLDQWEVVLSHMDKLGILAHAVLSETENESLFEFEEGGEFAASRKLFYREMVARLAHHPALIWNLGEENGGPVKKKDASFSNTDAQRKQFSSYLKALDPYDHPIVVHTFPNQRDVIYGTLLGHPDLDGPSIQTDGDVSIIHEETLKWVTRSKEAGHSWVVCIDEPGSAQDGVVTDSEDYWHDTMRKQALWGNLMAGGSGIEWYFGYKHPHNDMDCEDWRSRDHLWDLTRFAVQFFQDHLPFQEMVAADEATSNPKDYCLAKEGSLYCIYLPDGGTTQLNLGDTSSEFSVQWYDPRNGGELLEGSITRVTGPGLQSLGKAPGEPDSDWVILVSKQEG